MKKQDTADIILSGLFIALISMGAYIKINLFTIPFTLQVLFVLLAGNLLKPKYAVATLLSYLILGLIGLPVFSGGGGITYVFNPTFGYIIGFLFAVFNISKLVEKIKPKSFWNLAFINFSGLLIIYVFGIGYYYFIMAYYVGDYVKITSLLVYGFLIFLPLDIVYCFFSALVLQRIGKRFLKS